MLMYFVSVKEMLQVTVNSRHEEGGQRAARHDGVGNGKWEDPWEQLQAKLPKYVHILR